MGRRKNLPPSWKYNSNPYSKFTMLYEDLFLSPEFQALDHATQHFYICCRINAITDNGWGALVKHTKERNARMDLSKMQSTQEMNERMDNDNGYFVMPAAHMKRFGYTRQHGYKLMKKLIDAGFVEEVENNKSQLKMNCYKFSSKFKSRVRSGLQK